MTSHNAKYTKIEPGWFVHYEVVTERRRKSFKTEAEAREWMNEQRELDKTRPLQTQMGIYRLARIQTNVLEHFRNNTYVIPANTIRVGDQLHLQTTGTLTESADNDVER